MADAITRSSGPGANRSVADAMFGRLLAAATAFGALIRLAYLASDRRPWVGGDGYSYHIEALRLADGLGYTSGFGDVGAQIAHHPPAWVTLLGAVSWLGGRSLLAHQLVAVAIGIGVVVLVGLVGRRYFDARIGILAALIAAVYPGFWVMEPQVLSEPLGLLLLGVFVLIVAGLRESPTVARSAAVGVVVGFLALVRSEELALLVVVVMPVLATARGVLALQRVAQMAVVLLVCAGVLAPWTIFNSTRFANPVLLSTNGGSTILAGNCPPATYRGELLGYYDSTCELTVGARLVGLDRSQRDRLAMEAGLRNMAGHLEQLPVVVAARLGRMLAVFRPSQTVALAAGWMKTGTWPIWAWVVSFWLLALAAVVGAADGLRTRRFVLPLLGPFVIACGVVAVAYGEPRYHTVADFGVVVLAAAGMDAVVRRFRRD